MAITVEVWANDAVGTVTSGGTTAPTAGTSESWTVTASVAFPVASSGATPPTQFYVCDVAVPTEKMLVTVAPGGSGSGQSWTVTRGADSTATTTHASGFTIQQVATHGTLAGFLQANQALLLGQIAPAVSTLTDAATVTVNALNGNDFRLLFTSGIGATRAMGNPSNSQDGQRIAFHFTQDATGSRVVTWGANYVFGAAGAPTLTTTANAVDVVGFIYNATKAKWLYCGSALGF